MKANELRIGNIIEQIDNGIGFHVSEKNISAIIINLDKFKPIPLTEEWLLKFGFIQDGEYWDNDEVIILQSPGKQNFLLSIGTEYTTGQPFEYVHKLQNLYFALTGEELSCVL